MGFISYEFILFGVLYFCLGVLKPMPGNPMNRMEDSDGFSLLTKLLITAYAIPQSRGPNYRSWSACLARQYHANPMDL